MLQFIHTWEWVVDKSPHTGKPKTQTRRLALPEPDGTGSYDCEMLSYPNGILSACRLKKDEWKWTVRYQVGQTHAVVPNRCRSAIWIDGKGKWVEPIQYRGEYTAPDNEWLIMRIDNREYYKEKGFHPAYVRITDIRREDVRNISFQDAIAEGFYSQYNFLETWIKMHDKQIYMDWCADAEYYGNDAYFHPDRPAPTLNTVMKRLVKERPAERYTAWVLNIELVKEKSE